MLICVEQNGLFVFLSLECLVSRLLASAPHKLPDAKHDADDEHHEHDTEGARQQRDDDGAEGVRHLVHAVRDVVVDRDRVSYGAHRHRHHEAVVALPRDTLGEVGEACLHLGSKLDAVVEFDRAGRVRRSSELSVVLLDLLAPDRLELGLSVVKSRRAKHLDEGDSRGTVIRRPIAIVESVHKNI